MKKVVIINSSALRLKVIADVFAKKFPDEELEFIPLEVPYECSDIISRNECLAVIREAVVIAQQEIPDASYYIALRGRFQETKEGLEECGIAFVQNNAGTESYSQAVSFHVPEPVAELLRKGVKFAKAVEQTYNLEGIREGGGYCGYLTGDIVTKSDQYFQAMTIALCGLGVREKEGNPIAEIEHV